MESFETADVYGRTADADAPDDRNRPPLMPLQLPMPLLRDLRPIRCYAVVHVRALQEGGYVPALSEILPAIERAGLYVTDIEVLRLHYAETLRAWRKRFNASRRQVAEIYDERFCRMWEFYLAGCEAGFRHGGLLNFQIQLAKQIDAVPLTL